MRSQHKLEKLRLDKFIAERQKEHQMEFTIKVFVTDTVIRWAIDYHLHRDLKPTKKIIKEFLKTQIGLFGTDEDSLIGRNLF